MPKLESSRPREISGHFIFLPFLINHINSCHLLIKIVADSLKANSSLVKVYNPLVVERLERKKRILWTGVLCTHNEMRSGVSLID